MVGGACVPEASACLPPEVVAFRLLVDGRSLSSGGFAPPALLGSVDRWPLANVHRQIPEGRPAVVSAVRRRARGRCPSPVGRMPQPRGHTPKGARPGPAADRPWGSQWGQ